jgi:hypothetical protein
MSKEWDKERIQALLASNDKAVMKALMVVYGNQTRDEKIAEHTHHHNKTGFNGRDANIMSKFAAQVTAKNWLSRRQMEICRRVLPKYWKQLQKEIERRAAEAPAKPVPVAPAPVVLPTTTSMAAQQPVLPPMQGSWG